LLSISSLSNHRWAVPILANLAATGGARFVPLANELGISRDVLRQTLDALIETKLVMRNPGYGHPTRPEYVLTAKGRRIAPACAKLVQEIRRQGMEDVVLKKWSMPIVAALGRESRYGELRRSVGATPRALTLTLKELVACGLVERRVHTGFPPTTTYRLTPRSRTLRLRVTRLVAVL
jgi:DNA-binding HxlR family transcriptional regulator